MHHSPPNPSLSWPELPDEVAVALHDVIQDFAMLFESHYLCQIERYYHERTREHLLEPGFIQPKLFGSDNPNEPPF